MQRHHGRVLASQHLGLQRLSVPNLRALPRALQAFSATREYKLHRYMPESSGQGRPETGGGSWPVLWISVKHLRLGTSPMLSLPAFVGPASCRWS